MTRSLRLTACAFILGASASLSGCYLDTCVGCFNCVSCLVGGPTIGTLPSPGVKPEKTLPFKAPIATAGHAGISY